MKRLLTLLTLILSFTLVMGQELTVKNFALAARDLTASTQPRNDNNGDACALIKVQLAKPGATFHGNVMGDTPYSQSEYFVYMSKGSKMLQVKLDGYLPVLIDFEKDWGIKGVESLSTYVLSITLPNVVGQSVDDGMSYFTLTVTPKNASVLLDGDLQALNEEGVLSLRLPRGRHSYKIVARGYAEKTKSFSLGAERLDLAETLVSSKAALSVTCATSGADIYINDEKKGNTSWNGTIAPGNYLIEARKEGFITQQKSITLSDNQSLKVDLPALMASVGQLDINYMPVNAEVVIDGEKKGTSPNLFKNLTVGSHHVEIRKEGYQNETKNVTIIEGQTASLSGSLVALASSTSSLDTEAMYNMGEDYYYGRNGKTKDYTEAAKWYRKAAEHGYADGQNDLGNMYYDGLGVARDYAEAFKWYRKAAEQGDAKGQNNLGYMYSNGLDVTQDYAEAVKWYRKAAEQGYAMGQNNLGLMYSNGRGVAQDYAEAVKWFRKAAEQGNANGQNNLGVMYANGRGVAQDYAEAVKWYRKAAEQGNANGQNNLGDMFLSGQGVTQDYAEAVKWYRKSAEQGYAQGQFNLGFMCEFGIGITQDYVEAVKWYRKAAEQGDAKGQLFLGSMYREGLGVAQDYAEAVKWFRKAAEQSNVLGQFNLGNMYSDGLGVTQDYAEAVKWFRKAAEQGLASGQYNLGLMYYNGTGVPKDLNEAKKWFQKAAAQGHEGSKNMLEKL